jgi:heme exporter protein A
VNGLIVAQGLTKQIGSKKILKGIDLEINSGEFVTCFGPNGAGKSTTMKILSLLSKPSSGKLFIDGKDTKEHGDSLRSKVGVISHNTFLYDNLTAKENLQFYGKMYSIANLNTRVDQLLENVGLTYAAKDTVRGFSRGMQQRLAIARSLVHNPPILLMDEPYTGLDEMAKEILNGVLRQLSQEKHTVFLITHDFDQGLEQSDQTIILVGGKIVHRCSPKGISREDFRQLYLKSVGGAPR